MFRSGHDFTKIYDVPTKYIKYIWNRGCQRSKISILYVNDIRFIYMGLYVSSQSIRLPTFQVYP